MIIYCVVQPIQAFPEHPRMGNAMPRVWSSTGSPSIPGVLQRSPSSRHPARGSRCSHTQHRLHRPCWGRGGVVQGGPSSREEWRQLGTGLAWDGPCQKSFPELRLLRRTPLRVGFAPEAVAHSPAFNQFQCNPHTLLCHPLLTHPHKTIPSDTNCFRRAVSKKGQTSFPCSEGS